MEKNERDLLVLKTKLEIYKEVDKRVQGIIDGDIDMVFEYSDDLYRTVEKLEEDIDDLELKIEDSEHKEKLDIVSDFVKNMETWKELSDSEAAAVNLRIATDNINSISTSSSLHVFEEKFYINGETYRFLSAISGGEELTIEKLVK